MNREELHGLAINMTEEFETLKKGIIEASKEKPLVLFTKEEIEENDELLSDAPYYAIFLKYGTHSDNKVRVIKGETAVVFGIDEANYGEEVEVSIDTLDFDTLFTFAMLV